MRTALVAGALALGMAPAAAQEVPNLVGKWSGQVALNGVEQGMLEEATRYPLDVHEQKGRAFRAHNQWGPGDDEKAEWYGVIGFDNQTLAVVDDDGSFYGRLTDPDTMELCRTDVGNDDGLAICFLLTRQP